MSNETTYAINLTGDGNNLRGAITIIENGKSRTWTDGDPRFNHVFAAVKLGKSLDEAAVYTIPKNIVHLSPRVSLNGDTLVFDGMAVDPAIQELAERWAVEGRPLTNVVNFLELLADNITENSRVMLFRWLESQELIIDEEGYVVGYRGLRSDRCSSHAGGAYIQKRNEDGEWGPREWVDGHVPNEIGTRISLDPEQVDFNPDAGCSRGLHVGSESYARSWGDHDVTIVVRVNPADVASVPNGEFDKMRVLAYEIIGDIDDGKDHEPEPDYELAQVPNPDLVDEVLDDVVPKRFRDRMNPTKRWMSRRRREEDLDI